MSNIADSKVRLLSIFVVCCLFSPPGVQHVLGAATEKPHPHHIMREVNRVYQSPDLQQSAVVFKSTVVLNREEEPPTEIVSVSYSFRDGSSRRTAQFQIPSPGNPSQFALVWTLQNEVFKLREIGSDPNGNPHCKEMILDVSSLPPEQKRILSDEFPPVFFETESSARAAVDNRGREIWELDIGPLESESGIAKWTFGFLQKSFIAVNSKLVTTDMPHSKDISSIEGIQEITTLPKHSHDGIDFTKCPPELKSEDCRLIPEVKGLFHPKDEIFDLHLGPDSEVIPVEELQRYIASARP